MKGRLGLFFVEIAVAVALISFAVVTTLFVVITQENDIYSS